LHIHPDWKVVLWNESSFDVSNHPFTASAYQAKKYAFVSDYIRAWALFNFGGVYLDADVELLQPLDQFMLHDSFTGFECDNVPFTALWASKPSHAFAKTVLDYYDDRIYRDVEPPNTTWISRILADKYGVDVTSNSFQVAKGSEDYVAIYPSSFFCIGLPCSFAVHHFDGSWLRDRPSSRAIPLGDQLRADCLATLLLASNKSCVYRSLALSITLWDLYGIFRSYIALKSRAFFKQLFLSARSVIKSVSLH